MGCLTKVRKALQVEHRPPELPLFFCG